MSGPAPTSSRRNSRTAAVIRHRPSALAFLPAALLAAGCAAPTSKAPDVWWSTINPSDVSVSEKVRSYAPYDLRFCPSLAVLNFDEDYKGDDTPWIDLNDGFRAKLADCMHGYDPAAVTLGDLIWARNNFLRKRLGDDYLWKQLGRNDEELIFAAGTKCESIQKYFAPARRVFPGLFPAPKTEKCQSEIAFTVVHDMYRPLSGKEAPVWDMSVYLESVNDETLPCPKTTYTLLKEDLVRQLAVEGTERMVSGATAVDIETPRGRLTVYRPGDPTWRFDHPQERFVALAIMQLLNALPEERFPELRVKEE